MTADTDALRLVPEKTAEDAPSWYCVAGASAWANGWNACAQSVAAAPAVQPAAGREEIEKLIVEANDFTERMISQPWACELIERLIAAISTRAQASESLRASVAQGFMDRRKEDLTLRECREIVNLVLDLAQARAVLSAPQAACFAENANQAGEGEGES